MSKYIIKLVGCDDNTEFEIEIDDYDELSIVKKIAKKSQETSISACMPKMYVYKQEKIEIDYE